MNKLRLIFRQMLVRFSDAVAPSKMTSVKVEGKKNSFSRILQLIKYEREKIPLPKVTIPELRNEEDKKQLADEESAFQHYYLYQFINIEKQFQFKKKREANQKRLAHVISFMHFLSMTYPDSRVKCGPSMNLRIYNPTVQSITFGKEQQLNNQHGR